jgi:uncharacterized glyoxalase superfamily protein PhnB
MAITPYLYYQNVDVALKFLSKAFGFRKYGSQMREARTERLIMPRCSLVTT